MKSQKVVIYRHESALCGHYLKKDDSNCLLLIAPAADDVNKSQYNSILKKVALIFANHNFSILYIPTRHAYDKSKNQDNLNDILEAADWLSDKHVDATRQWVAGIGYGGSLSLNVAMRRPRFNGFASINPLINKDLTVNSLTPCPSGIIVHGENDEYTSYTVSENLSSSLITQKDQSITFQLIEDANHLYDEHTAELTNVLNNYLSSAMYSTTYHRSAIAA